MQQGGVEQPGMLREIGTPEPPHLSIRLTSRQSQSGSRRAKTNCTYCRWDAILALLLQSSMAQATMCDRDPDLVSWDEVASFLPLR